MSRSVAGVEGVRAEHRQVAYRVRLEWGREGVAMLAAECAALVIVDVLSFSTAVDVAVGRGARVLPRAPGDATPLPPGAVPAGPRDGSGPSLRPSSLVGLEPGTLLALPSPNGAALSAAASAGRATVFAGCLRNASAVARAALEVAGEAPIGLVPAGERWPDDTMRVAAEDAIGAGAVAAALAEELHAGTAGAASELSPEAALAAAQFGAAREAGLLAVLSAVASGRELIADGYSADVALGAALDASPHVPVLHDGGVYSPRNTGPLPSPP